MSKSTGLEGIPSNPIIFRDGEPLPGGPKLPISNPQNLWDSIEASRAWVGYNILGTTELGIQNGITPYKEPMQEVDTAQLIEEADDRRGSDDRYTDMRNLDSFAAFLALTGTGKMRDEFKHKTVLDIGSGAGAFGEDLRRQSKAHVTEVDFSMMAMESLQPILRGRGSRVLADGIYLPFRDGTYERTTSMYSTSVHTYTMRDRLRGLTEQIRVTEPDGRAFVVPLFGAMMLRQTRWSTVQGDENKLGLSPADVQEFEAMSRREGAIDYALTTLLRKLMINGTVRLTPILTQMEKNKEIHDCISGIFDVQETLTKAEADELIEESTALFL